MHEEIRLKLYAMSFQRLSLLVHVLVDRGSMLWELFLQSDLGLSKVLHNEYRAKRCPFRPSLNARYMPNWFSSSSKTKGALSRCCRWSQLTSSSSRNFKNERATFPRARFVLVGARLAKLIFRQRCQSLGVIVKYAGDSSSSGMLEFGCYL